MLPWVRSATGDAEPYMALYSDGGDVTLGDPFGPFAGGRRRDPRAGELAASRYRDGQVVGFERVAAHVADGLACLAEVERFRAKVGGSDSPVWIGLRVAQRVPEEGRNLETCAPGTPIRSRSTPQAAESVIGG